MTQHAALRLRTEDDHTAGKPFRIATEGLPDVAGNTLAGRRLKALGTENQVDRIIREPLCAEPRGHADMHGGFVTRAGGCPPRESRAATGTAIATGDHLFSLDGRDARGTGFVLR